MPENKHCTVRADGETKNISQQEYSTGHGPGLARRAQEMLRVATETGECSEVGVDRPP